MVSVKELISEIKIATKKINNLSDKEMIKYINRYLDIDIMTDIAPFVFRQAVRFHRVHPDCDLLKPSSLKIRDVSEVKGVVSELEYDLNRYTSQGVEFVKNTISNGFYSNSIVVSDSARGGVYDRVVHSNISFSSANPVNMDLYSSGHVSAYFISFVIVDEQDRQVVSISSYHNDETVRLTENDVDITVNYKTGTLSILTTRTGTLTATMYTSGYSHNSTYKVGRLYSKSYCKTRVFSLECYIKPMLISSVDDTMDPSLIKFTNLIIFGASLMIAQLTGTTGRINELADLYDVHVTKFLTEAENQRLVERNVRRNHPSMFGFRY